MRVLMLFACLALPAIAPGQPAAAPRTIEVRLSNFDFTPGTIQLHAGQPIVLHLVNTAGGGHNFAAPELFAAASAVSGAVTGGIVEVAGHQSVDIRLTPARGRYRLKCTHTLHSTFGMRGEVIVS